MKRIIKSLSFLLLLGSHLYSQAQSPKWEIKWQRDTLSFRGISVVDAQTIWVSGSNSTVVRSFDGGNAWQADTVTSGVGLDFRDIHALDARRAYLMSAGPGEKSRIYFTRDSGTTWDLIHTNIFEQGFFNGFAFWNDSSAALVGDPLNGKMFVMVMQDGRNWQRIPPGQTPAMQEGEYGFAASGTNIAVHGSATVWIASGGSAARVFRSQNRGQTWQVFETPVKAGTPSTGIFSIAFQDAQHGIVVGGDYRDPTSGTDNLAITDDGGASWRLIDAGSVTYRSCIAFVPTTPAIVTVGERGSDFSPDGGRTWYGLKLGFHTIGVSSSGRVWAAGKDGRIAELELLLSH